MDFITLSKRVICPGQMYGMMISEETAHFQIELIAMIFRRLVQELASGWSIPRLLFCHFQNDVALLMELFLKVLREFPLFGQVIKSSIPL